MIPPSAGRGWMARAWRNPKCERRTSYATSRQANRCAVQFIELAVEGPDIVLAGQLHTVNCPRLFSEHVSRRDCDHDAPYPNRRLGAWSPCTHRVRKITACAPLERQRLRQYNRGACTMTGQPNQIARPMPVSIEAIAAARPSLKSAANMSSAPKVNSVGSVQPSRSRLAHS